MAISILNITEIAQSIIVLAAITSQTSADTQNRYKKCFLFKVNYFITKSVNFLLLAKHSLIVIVCHIVFEEFF